MILLSSSSLVENCTIVNNSTLYAAGGVQVDAGKLRNSIIVDNWMNDELWNFTIGEKNVTIENCLTTTEDVAALNEVGSGNIGADPRFKNPTKGDYRLQSISPAINAGLYQAWMAGALDLDGNPRIFGKVVDLGCYENMASAGTILFLR